MSSIPAAPLPTSRTTHPGLAGVLPKSIDVSAKLPKGCFPPELFSFALDKEEIVQIFPNDDIERRISAWIPLSLKESSDFTSLKQELLQENMCVPDDMIMRYLAKTSGDVPLSLQMIRETVTWRTDYFAKPLSDLNRELLSDLNEGFVYISGRDSCLRPLITLRVEQLPDWASLAQGPERALRALIFCLEFAQRFLLIPGRVENFVVLIDLNGVGAGLALCLSRLLPEILRTLNKHYVGMNYRTFLCNVGFIASRLLSLAKAVCTPRQAHKIQELRNVAYLKEYFSPQQLEARYGGTAPNTVKGSIYPFRLPAGPFSVRGDAPSPRPTLPENWDETFRDWPLATAVLTRGEELSLQLLPPPLPPSSKDLFQRVKETGVDLLTGYEESHRETVRAAARVLPLFDKGNQLTPNFVLTLTPEVLFRPPSSLRHQCTNRSTSTYSASPSSLQSQASGRLVSLNRSVNVSLPLPPCDSPCSSKSTKTFFTAVDCSFRTKSSEDRGGGDDFEDASSLDVSQQYPEGKALLAPVDRAARPPCRSSVWLLGACCTPALNTDDELRVR